MLLCHFTLTNALQVSVRLIVHALALGFAAHADAERLVADESQQLARLALVRQLVYQQHCFAHLVFRFLYFVLFLQLCTY